MIENRVFTEEDTEQASKFVKNNILKIIKIHKYIKNSKRCFKIYYKEK